VNENTFGVRKNITGEKERGLKKQEGGKAMRWNGLVGNFLKMVFCANTGYYFGKEEDKKFNMSYSRKGIKKRRFTEGARISSSGGGGWKNLPWGVRGSLWKRMDDSHEKGR